jgi:nitroimidazol reductase NimA-like FMN-containing flavoprotein (pyridoxamine 5'-phosphate oxidase superfamily)|tara:strand:+ start:260 stop:505 length:246 start_codon:yes stop_codon:yes gene_type:complete
MAKKENEQEQTVTISGKKHNVADLSQEQVVLFNHVADLENKIRTISFSLDQAQGGRNYFMGLLTASMEAPAEEAVEKEAAE